MRTICITLVGIALGAAPPPALAQSGDSAVDARIVEFVDAWARGDAAALAQQHTDDAIRISETGGTVIGREAIQEQFAGYLAGPMDGSRISIEVGRIVDLSDDVLIIEGSYEISGGEAPATGTYVNTVLRDGDSVFIAATGVFTDDPEMAEQ